jgi:hypothetical protein
MLNFISSSEISSKIPVVHTQTKHTKNMQVLESGLDADSVMKTPPNLYETKSLTLYEQPKPALSLKYFDKTAHVLGVLENT